MKKLLAIILCCLMVVQLAACGDGGTGTPANSPGDSSKPANSEPVSSVPGNNDSTPTADSVRDTLRMSVTSDFGVFNYVGVTGGQWYSVMLCLSEPLWDCVFDENGDLQMVWLLATGYDVITPTQWTLHLREGVTFSNGNPFTADDVLFTFDNEVNGGVSTGIRAQSIDLENTKKIDDYTIDLRFTEPNIQGIVAYSDMLIFDAESYADTDFSTAPVGTGPYKLTEYTVNSSIKLERRDDYWGEPPAIKYLEFSVLAEPSQIVNALDTGTLDVGMVEGADFDYVSAMPEYNVLENTEGSWSMLEFNTTENSFFHNEDARFAVAYAVNRQAIADMVYYGRADLMKSVVSPTMVDYEERLDYIHDIYTKSQDLELAKQYAEKSGIAGKTFRIITDGTPNYTLTAEILQSQLAEIGVKLEIINHEPANFRAAQRELDKWDLCISTGISPNKYCGDHLFTLFSFSAMYGYNSTYSTFDDIDRYHEIMSNALYNPDPQVRSDTIYELAKMYADNCLRLAICTINYATAYSVDLEGPFLYRVSQQRRVQDFKFK